MIQLVTLRWKYNVRADVIDTVTNARNCGFLVEPFEGQPKNSLEPYPLNQIRISGGSLPNNVRIHVGPNVTQIYYQTEDSFELDRLEKIVSALVDTERTLNVTVVFASDEVRRFERETATPVFSIGMLKLQMAVNESIYGICGKMEQVALDELNSAFIDVAQGRIQLGNMKLQCLCNELESFQQNLIDLAKDWKSKEQSNKD